MGTVETWIAVHRKFLVALAGAAVTAIGFAWPDAPWVGVIVAFATALGVNQVPNSPAPAEPEPVPADAAPPSPAPQ
jgi:hypothetical protein